MSSKAKEFKKELVSLKSSAESYVVLSMYKNTELYFDANLKVDDIHNKDWKFYYLILQKAIKKGHKVIDDITMGLIIEEHKESVQKMYDSLGGWNTIESGKTLVQEENFDGYLEDIKKFNALIKLNDFGYPIYDKFDTFKNLPVSDIQEALEGMLHTVFADVDVTEKVEDLRDGLDEVVDEAHKGLNVGLPYSSPMLNKIVNGQSLGNITMMSANSGMGKTFLTIAQILPNVIELGEKLTIMANEEDSAKWQREIITWVANNEIENGNFNKSRWNQGNFSDEEMELLKKSTTWLREKMESGHITFVNFSSFSMNKAIKLIKKSKAINGVDYFILDTFKLDSDSGANEQAWLLLQQNIVKLYDTIKEQNLNVHVWITYQLGKSAMMTRYLSQNSLGMSKNVVDVISVLLLGRHALESEKESGKNKVAVKTRKGIKYMSDDKEYIIMFFGKNRFGQKHRQAVFEVDMARNIVKDFGTCLIEQDF